MFPIYIKMWYRH